MPCYRNVLKNHVERNCQGSGIKVSVTDRIRLFNVNCKCLAIEMYWKIL